MLAVPGRGIDLKNVRNYLTRIDFLANQGRLVLVAAVTGYDHQRHAISGGRCNHGLPLLRCRRRQSLHSTNEIEADLDEFKGLFVQRRPTVLAVSGRNSEFFVKIA